MKIKLHPGFLIQEVDGEAVLLSVDQGVYYGLNDVGTRAWEYLTDTGSIDDAVKGILEKYAVDEISVRTDLEAFVKDLLDQGLAVLVGP